MSSNGAGAAAAAAAAANKRGITWKNLEGKGNLANVREFEKNNYAPSRHGSQKTRTKKNIPNIGTFMSNNSRRAKVNSNAKIALEKAAQTRALVNSNAEDPENVAARVQAARAAAMEAELAAALAASAAGSTRARRTMRRRRGGRRNARRHH